MRRVAALRHRCLLSEQPEKQAGFSTRKMNELLDLSRAANKLATHQIAATRALEKAIREQSSVAPVRAEAAPIGQGSGHNRLRRIVDILTLAASVATVIALIYAAASLHVAIDAGERASVSQTYYAPIQVCSKNLVGVRNALEGAEVFSVLTNTGRLPITVMAIRASEELGSIDLDFSATYVDRPDESLNNQPFTIEVGEALALSILYGTEIGEINDDGSFSWAFSTHPTILLSDGSVVVPEQNDSGPAPELVRKTFRELAQLVCDDGRHEATLEGDTDLFEGSLRLEPSPPPK